jgi:hypothetical protein
MEPEILRSYGALTPQKELLPDNSHIISGIFKGSKPSATGRRTMLQYSCDFCGKLKSPRDNWLLGMAAETVSPSSAHRTVTMALAWNYPQAVDPLAVHFCSAKCKENYIRSLFDRESQGEIVEEETVELVPGSRRSGGRKTTRRKTQSRARKRKRAA